MTPRVRAALASSTSPVSIQSSLEDGSQDTDNALYEAWRRGYNAALPGKASLLTYPEKADLRRFSSYCLQSGHRLHAYAPEIVGYAVEHWSTIGGEAVRDDGVRDFPRNPVPHFLIRHARLCVNSWLEATGRVLLGGGYLTTKEEMGEFLGTKANALPTMAASKPSPVIKSWDPDVDDYEEYEEARDASFGNESSKPDKPVDQGPRTPAEIWGSGLEFEKDDL